MESIARDICGSASGYRKHRRMKESKCQPCKDAYNVHRRDTYNPDKSRQYKSDYYLRKPEKKELSRQSGKKNNLSSEEKERRRLERLAITNEKNKIRSIEKELKIKEKERVKEKKKELHKVEMKRRADIRKVLSEKRRIARNKRQKDKYKAESVKKLEERLCLQKKKEEEKELARKKKASIKAEEKERLNNQHGTSIGDYERCKRNRAVACGLCLAVAAKYRREQVAKDPQKFREKERRSRQKNGYVTSRDRAKKNGGQYAYYTRKQIFDRDGYDCYLCQEPVDFTAPHVIGQPGWETYPHVEHVVPLALGGDDTLENVKIAHAKCNMDKGVRLLPSTL